MHRTRSLAGQTLHFGDRVVNVDERNLVRDQQARGTGRGEVDQRVVEGLISLAPAALHLVVDAEGADLAVQHLGVHPVAIHVLKPLGGIVMPRASPRLMRELARQREAFLAELLCDRLLFGGYDRVILFVEFLRQPRLDLIVGGGDVRIR